MTQRSIPRMESIRSCSDITGLSYWYLSKLVKENAVRYVRSGKKIYINMNSLADLLEGRSLDEQET